MPILSVILLILNAVITFVLYPTKVENFTVAMLVVYLVTIIIAFWLDRKRTAK